MWLLFIACQVLVLETACRVPDGLPRLTWKSMNALSWLLGHKDINVAAWLRNVLVLSRTALHKSVKLFVLIATFEGCCRTEHLELLSILWGDLDDAWSVLLNVDTLFILACLCNPTLRHLYPLTSWIHVKFLLLIHTAAVLCLPRKKSYIDFLGGHLPWRAGLSLELLWDVVHGWWEVRASIGSSEISGEVLSRPAAIYNLWCLFFQINAANLRVATVTRAFIGSLASEVGTLSLTCHFSWDWTVLSLHDLWDLLFSLIVGLIGSRNSHTWART